MKLSSHRPVIECRDVWKIYEEGTPAEVRALQGINLKVMKGELVSIQGASGSGKSTLLHIVGCLDKPTRGKVLVEGKDISQLKDDELALIRRNNIGFVFQFFNLIPSLSALQNVELPMVFKGLGEEERQRKAVRILTEVGLGKRTEHKPSEMSGGERQRVAVARALANEPLLVLADEPTGNLDSKTGKEIMDLFLKLNRAGRTVVIITHDPVVARRAKRSIKLRDGKVY